MKKIALILLAAILPLAAQAQKVDFRQLQEKYGGKEGYTVIEITAAMLDLICKSDRNTQVNNMIGAIDGIQHITIISAECRNEEFSADMKEISTGKSEYKLLTSVMENGQNAMFLYKNSTDSSKKETSPRVSELIMIVSGQHDNLIMCIRGDFSIKQINSVINRNSSE